MSKRKSENGKLSALNGAGQAIKSKSGQLVIIQDVVPKSQRVKVVDLNQSKKSVSVVESKISKTSQIVDLKPQFSSDLFAKVDKKQEFNGEKEREAEDEDISDLVKKGKSFKKCRICREMPAITSDEVLPPLASLNKYKQ